MEKSLLEWIKIADKSGWEEVILRECVVLSILYARGGRINRQRRKGDGVGGGERSISQHAAGAELPSALPPANTCLHFCSLRPARAE